MLIYQKNLKLELSSILKSAVFACIIVLQVMIDYIARMLCLRDKVTDPEYTTASQKRWNPGRVAGTSGSKYHYTDGNFAQVRLLTNGRDNAYHRTATPPPFRPNLGSMFGGMSEIQESGISGAETRTGLQHGTDDFTSQSINNPLIEEIRAIRDMLEKVRDKKSKMEEKERFVREWRVIACITDRVIFIIYLLINFIGLLVIFLWQFHRKSTSD